MGILKLDNRNKLIKMHIRFNTIVKYNYISYSSGINIAHMVDVYCKSINIIKR